MEFLGYAMVRQVRPDAVVTHILHVQALIGVEFLQHGITATVELRRRDAKPVAKFDVEGRSGLQPNASTWSTA